MPSADFVSFITGDLRNAASPQPSSLVRTPTTHMDVVQTHPSCHPINSPLKKAVQKPREVGLQQLGTPARKLREMGRNKDARLICSFAEELERSFKRFLPLDSLGLRPGQALGHYVWGSSGSCMGEERQRHHSLEMFFSTAAVRRALTFGPPAFSDLSFDKPGPTGEPNLSWCTGHVLVPDESVSIRTHRADS